MGSNVFRNETSSATGISGKEGVAITTRSHKTSESSKIKGGGGQGQGGHGRRSGYQGHG